MKKLVFLLLITWFFAGCTSNTIMEKPDDLIPKKEMINLLTDLYLANAAFNVKNKHDERQKNYVGLIYQKYGIDSARFSRSNLYYMSKIDDYEKMHQAVFERIKKMREESEKEVKKADSIERLKAESLK